MGTGVLFPYDDPRWTVASEITVVVEGRAHTVTGPRLCKMVLWIVRNSSKLVGPAKGQVVFDYAGQRVAVKHTEAGEVTLQG